MNNPQQPREYDAVLGGNSPSLEGAAVLGGIEGVKLRLQNPDVQMRIAALEQALNYGEQGLDLVIECLKDESWNVEYAAYSLLKSRTEARARQTVVEFDTNLRQKYTRLRDLLSEEKWKEADEETIRVMLAVAKREKEGWLDVNSIDNFPCADLRTIDQLWVKYSNGKFGFSVQKRIYQGLGGTREYNYDIWCKFGYKVGWKRDVEWWFGNMQYDKKAPEGHLPKYFKIQKDVRNLAEVGWVWYVTSFFSRVETCKV